MLVRREKPPRWRILINLRGDDARQVRRAVEASHLPAATWARVVMVRAAASEREAR